MIISDLSYCEVLAEAPSIVGGALESVQLAQSSLRELSAGIPGVRIDSILTSGNASASGTNITFTANRGATEGAVSSSSASSQQAR